MSYELLISRKRRIFLPASYIQRQNRKTKGAVESARAGLSPQEGDVRKRKEKKETKEGEKVAYAKAIFRVPYTKNSSF